MEKVNCVVTCNPDKYADIFFNRIVEFFRVPAVGEYIHMYLPKIGDTTVRVVHVIHVENGAPVVSIELV